MCFDLRLCRSCAGRVFGVNLRFGKLGVTGEDIEAAARTANAHELNSRLPRDDAR